MKKRNVIGVILVCTLVLVFSGCATNVGPNWPDVWFVTQIDPAKHDYTILGHVSIERSWVGVLGRLFETGGVTHADILAEARRQFPRANAVLNVQVSSRRHRTLPPLFFRRSYTVTALAVQFATEQRNAGIHSTRRSD